MVIRIINRDGNARITPILIIRQESKAEDPPANDMRALNYDYSAIFKLSHKTDEFEKKINC